MSFIKESKAVTSQNPDKSMFGSGDGLRNDTIVVKSRIQVPSCRRFSTRPTQMQQEKTKQVKEELQRAIKNLTKHPGITYRKSLTMAEITPTRKLKDKPKCNTPINLSLTRSFEGASISCRKEDAGRRIYQLLLLNAWRRRKIQVVSLSDSLASFETQNNKLELQVDALRRLRQAECEKRSEAVAESHALKNRVTEIVKDQQQLIDKAANLEDQMVSLKIENDKLSLCVQNSKNDWMTAVKDVRHLEHQLDTERDKIKRLRLEKRSILDQITQREQDLLVQSEKIINLEMNAKNFELSLKEANFSNNNCEKEKIEILKTLDKEVSTKVALQTQIKELETSKETLEIKVHEFCKFNSANKEAKRKLEKENRLLTQKLRETTEALNEERRRPWWKSAGELALAPLGVLQDAAYIMLPALNNENKK